VYGRKVTEFVIPSPEKGTTLTKKDFSAFAKGIYLVRFEGNSFNKTEKLIIE